MMLPLLLRVAACANVAADADADAACSATTGFGL